MPLIPSLGQQRWWDFSEARLASITNFRKEEEGQPRCLAEPQKAQRCSSVRSYRLMTILEVTRRFQSKKREEKHNLEKFPLYRKGRKYAFKKENSPPPTKETSVTQASRVTETIYCKIQAHEPPSSTF